MPSLTILRIIYIMLKVAGLARVFASSCWYKPTLPVIAHVPFGLLLLRSSSLIRVRSGAPGRSAAHQPEKDCAWQHQHKHWRQRDDAGGISAEGHPGVNLMLRCIA